MAQDQMEASGGIFMLSEPANALAQVNNKNDNIISDIDQNQLTTNSEDLRQLSRDVREYALNNPSFPRLKNDVRESSYSSRDGSATIYEQNDEMQRAAINKEVNREQEELFKSPDECWGWIVVLASLVCMVVVDGICFSYGLHCKWINQYFSLSSLSLSVLPGSLISGLYLITSPFANPLATYFDYRNVGMCGCLIATLSLFGSSFCTNYILFVVLFGVLTGIGFGLMYLPAIAIVAHWFQHLRAVAIGIALCGSGIGTCLIGLMLPTFISLFHGKGSLVILAAVCFQSMVGIALFRPYEVHQRLKQMKKDYEEWCMANIEYLQEKKRLKKEKKFEKRNRKEQKRREKIGRKKQIVIKRGSIFTRIMEEKNRQRNVSTGSLDGMLITQMNQLVTASQIDMNAQSLISSSIYGGSISYSQSNIFLQPSSLDRVVDATLQALKKSPSSVFQRSRANTASSGNMLTSLSSKKLSMNSMNEIITSSNKQDLLTDQIPIELVKEYMERQRSYSKDDAESGDRGETNFKVGSSLLVNKASSCVIEEEATSGSGDGLTGVNVISNDSVSQQYSLVGNGGALRVTNNPSIGGSSGYGVGGPSFIDFPPEVRKIIRDQLIKEMDRPGSRRDIYYCGSIHHLINLHGSQKKQLRTASCSNFQRAESGRFNVSTLDKSHLNVDNNNDYLDNVTNNSYQTNSNPTGGVTPANDDADFNVAWWKEMLDFKIFWSVSFMFLLFSSITMMLGFFVPFFFIPILLDKQSEWWISGAICALGSSNVLGRLIATLYIEKGWAFSYKKPNGANLTLIFLSLATISIFFIPFTLQIHVSLVLILSFIYGFSIAMIVSIRSILVVEFFGVENLTKSFTFLLIFQGLACIAGPVLAGLLCDTYNESMKCDASFIFSGSCYLISTIFIIILQKFNPSISNSNLPNDNAGMGDRCRPQSASDNMMINNNSRDEYRRWSTPAVQSTPHANNEFIELECGDSSEPYDNQTTQTTNLMPMTNLVCQIDNTTTDVIP